MYHVDRKVSYLGIDYKVIDVLDNDLLLVANEKDFELENYPLQTYIVPDVEVVEARKKTR